MPEDGQCSGPKACNFLIKFVHSDSKTEQ